MHAYMQTVLRSTCAWNSAVISACKHACMQHHTYIHLRTCIHADIIEDYMRMEQRRYFRLDGGTSLARRKFEIALFNRPESSVFAYLLSTRAGALGITLTGADTVIMFDSDWNPTWDKQAHDRAHRCVCVCVLYVCMLCVQSQRGISRRMIGRTGACMHVCVRCMCDFSVFALRAVSVCGCSC